jgi:hypothetical protein
LRWSSIIAHVGNFIFSLASATLNSFLDARHTVVRLELKGPDNSLRLRQIRVLGEVEGESLKIGRQHSAQTIQQRNCETETLRVFRLITSQVYSDTFLPFILILGMFLSSYFNFEDGFLTLKYVDCMIYT